MSVSLKKHLNSVYILSFFFNIARTLPHSILSLYLIQRGISVELIMLFQICYMVPIFILEFPSGILSDRIGRKSVYLISLLFLMLGFSLIGFSSFIFLIFIGQFFYGVSSALMTGTVESDLIIRLRTEVDKEKLDKTFKNFQSTSQIFTYAGMMIGGVLGSVVFVYISNYIYLISISLYFVVFLGSFLFLPSIKPEHKGIKIRNQILLFKNETKTFLKQKIIVLSILLICFLQFVLQPFFNWWQNIYVIKKIDPIYFGMIYSLFQLIGIVSALLFRKFKPTKTWHKILSIIIAGSIAISSLLLLSGLSFVLVFPIFMIPFDLYSNSMSFELNKNFSLTHISSQTSLISSTIRVFSVLSLLLNFTLSSFISINLSLIISISFAIFISLIAILVHEKYKKGIINTNQKQVD